MILALAAALTLVVLLAVLVLAWWFSGGGLSSLAIDPSLIAFGFPAEKYEALDRILDHAEINSLRRQRSMPSDLIEELSRGRRELAGRYLDELATDFRSARRLYLQSQATGLRASSHGAP